MFKLALRPIQTPIQWVMVLFPRCKATRVQSPFSAEVKWSHTSTTPLCFNGIDKASSIFLTSLFNFSSSSSNVSWWCLNKTTSVSVKLVSWITAL